MQPEQESELNQEAGKLRLWVLPTLSRIRCYLRSLRRNSPNFWLDDNSRRNWLSDYLDICDRLYREGQDDEAKAG